MNIPINLFFFTVYDQLIHELLDEQFDKLLDYGLDALLIKYEMSI